MGGVSLGTWLAVGGACTCATAVASASAVLYRGTLFNEEGTSWLLSMFVRGEDSKARAARDALRRGAEAATASKSSAPGFQESPPIDPALRRLAVPTAVKALAISTAMTVAVGSAASALLAYATSAEEAPGEPPVDDAAALERVERETEGEAKDSDRPEPNSIRRFLDDSFKGRGQPR